MSNSTVYKRLCPQCGKSFNTKCHNQKYCTDRCQQAGQKSYKTRLELKERYNKERLKNYCK